MMTTDWQWALLKKAGPATVRWNDSICLHGDRWCDHKTLKTAEKALWSDVMAGLR